MLLLRIVGVLAAIFIASGLVAYLLTRDRSYLRLAGRIAKWSLITVLIVMVLMFLERIIIL